MASNGPTSKNSQNNVASKTTKKNNITINLTNSNLLNQQKELEEEPKKMEEEERKKLIELEKQIKEIEDKFSFEQQNCQKVINLKEKEKEQKEKEINQLKSTNDELNEQLKFMKKQVKENFDSTSKEKEKNGQKIKSQKKKKNKLEEMLDEKEEELKLCINENKNKEKEIERLQKELDSKVNLEQFNNLKNQIKISKNKKEELEKQIEELEPIRLAHENCEEEKLKIKNEIYNLQKNLEEIKKTNRKKFIKETKDKRMVIKHNNMSKLFNDLDEEQIKNLKEQLYKKKIDKLWEKNKETENSIDNDIVKQEDDNKKNIKKLKYMPENYLEIVQKKQNFNTKMDFSKKVRNNCHKKEIKMDDLQITELPKIPLFDKNKKKALQNILPEKEIQKYEKRYEYINIEKDNLIRKYNAETKQLKTEQNILTKNSESFLEQLNENKKENILLDGKILEQEKQLQELKNKLKIMKDDLQKTKRKISNQEKVNGELLDELKRLPNEKHKEEKK